MKLEDQKIKTDIRFGILVFMVILGFSALLRGFSMEVIEGLPSGRVMILNDKWEMAEDGEMGGTEYRFRIPESAGGSLLLCMKTYLPEFQVLLDGEPIYSFSDAYAMDGRSQHMVSLPLNSQGKQLTLRTEPGGYAGAVEQSRIGNAYLGTEYEAAVKLFWDNLYALLFATFALLLGAGAIIVGCWMKRRISKAASRSLMSFGAFVLIAGIWVLTDSELLLFVTNQTAVVSLLSFVSFMIMPVFLLGLIRDILGKKQIVDALRWSFAAITAAYLINYLLQMFPGYLLLLPTHALCICSVLVVIKVGREKLKSGKNKKAQWIMAGVDLLSLCVIFALILFYIDPVSQYSNLYCLGILMFILCLGGAMLGVVYEQVEEKANMAVYKRLAYMDAMTGMENRTAFMEAQRQAETAGSMSCIMLDINNLKQINDRYGHQEGDRAIITVARAIQDTFGEIGTCFRIGGDEFVVFLQSSHTMEQITAKLDGMRGRLAAVDQTGGFSIDIAAGYVARQEGETVARMVERADAKMYEEKQLMKAGRDS